MFQLNTLDPNRTLEVLIEIIQIGRQNSEIEKEDYHFFFYRKESNFRPIVND